MEMTRKKPVLVGLSGGFDSLVAAYLMKIQKFELYGVLIANTPEVFQENGEDVFACHQTDARIENLKKICDHLQIPLTIVRSREEFHATVLDHWMSSKIELSKPRSCLDCHTLRMKILYQKMMDLGCDGIVTGHYAKIIRQSPDGMVSIHTSNDLAFDQSAQLATIDQVILSKLILPLSDLQKKEVQKIADSFELRPSPQKLRFAQCLPAIPIVNDWASKQIPPALVGEGDIVFKDQVVAKHAGFQTLEFGQDVKVSPRANDVPHKIIGSNWNDNKAILGPQEYFVDTGVFLNRCHWGVESRTERPLKGFIHGPQAENIEVLVYPKTLRAVMIELVEGELSFISGSQLSVFNRKGKNAKLLVTGLILGSFKSYPDHNLSIDIKGERGPEALIVDKDFNF